MNSTKEVREISKKKRYKTDDRVFRDDPNFKDKFAEVVNELIKQDIKPLSKRIKVFDDLCNEYIRATNENPPKKEMYKIAEEIIKLDKRENGDNNTLSDWQVNTRRKHEVPLEVATNIGTDYNNHEKPYRKYR